MNPLKVNLLDAGSDERPAPGPRFSLWKGALITVAALVVIVPIGFSFASVRLLKAAEALNPLKPKTEHVSILEQVRRLVSNGERQLKGEKRDRVNILVTGVGGAGHDGAQLTDTILFVSIQPSTGRVGMLSIPRDLWVTIPEDGLTRVNNANAFAENRLPGSGGEAAAKVIGTVLDQPVDYYLRVDFSAFKTLIDDVGGVTVNVDTAFTDYAYPTDNNLYQTLHFDKGWQTMNGETALKYTRSRHGDGGEASDFARSRRQQKILIALKDKIVSFDTLLNPSKVASILETLQTHVITNMELWEIVKVASFAKKVRTEALISRVLDDGPGGPLYATSIPVSNGDAYALLPRRGDWTDVRRIARDLLDENRQPAPTAAEQKQAARQAIKLEVQNGTTIPGLAQKTRDLLTKVGYQVLRIGNAKVRDVDSTVIYDLTNGAQPEALSTLKNLLGARVSLNGPGATDSHADFLVVVGKNTP